MSKAFPYQAYQADYSLLEKQAKKLKVIKKPKQTTNGKTQRQTTQSDSEELDRDFFTTYQKSPREIVLPKYFKAHIAKDSKDYRAVNRLKITKNLDVNLTISKNKRRNSTEAGDLLSERFEKRHFSQPHMPSDHLSRTGTINGSRCCSRHHAQVTSVNYARELLCRTVAEKKRQPILKPKMRPNLRVFTQPDILAQGKQVNSALRPETSPLKLSRRAPSITSQPETTMASNMKSSSRLENTTGRILESPGFEIEV